MGFITCIQRRVYLPAELSEVSLAIVAIRCKSSIDADSFRDLRVKFQERFSKCVFEFPILDPKRSEAIQQQLCVLGRFSRSYFLNLFLVTIFHTRPKIVCVLNDLFWDVNFDGSSEVIDALHSVACRYFHEEGSKANIN